MDAATISPTSGSSTPPSATPSCAGAASSSVIAAPLLQRGEILGAITVYTDRPDAFDEQDAAVLAGLATQAAVAIDNGQLIGELERSREENARRADAERTLREIAARVSAILDPGEVLGRIVGEAARLLESDGARIDLWDEELGALRWAYSAGDAMAEVPEWGRNGGLRPRQAVAGLAFAEQRAVMTEDFLADDRFDTTPEIEAFVRKAGIRAVISAPLTQEGGEPLGVLSVVSREPGAYTDAEVETLTALATHASIAITNADLMEELARSREDIERRAEAERSLRQIAARITALREPDDVLQLVIDEALRLLQGDGALIDQYDPDSGTLQWAYDAGMPVEQREAVKMTNLRLGEGASGKAVAEGRVVIVGDYRDGEFRHDDLADSLVAQAGVRDLIAAPIIGEAGPLGAIEVFSRVPHRFGEFDAAVLGGLAEQAAIAITNARLIDELERSQGALARRAETERSLRDITARIAALTDPDEVLERVVEDAKRLLATDGAHLTRMAPSRSYLVPVVVAGATDETTRDWLLGMRFPLGGGINGLAAEQGTPVWTPDYLADSRIPLEPSDLDVAQRLGLRGMAAAPLRAPGGEVIGTLAISTAEPRTFEADDLDLLQGLADQAAIALTNSNLLARLTLRGGPLPRPRADDAGRHLAGRPGWRLHVHGRHGRGAVRLADRGDHRQALRVPDRHRFDAPRRREVRRGRGDTRSRGARAVDPGPAGWLPFAAEVTTTGVFEDGQWVGAQGTVRDVSERERLERELRQSEERYRYLVQNAPGPRLVDRGRRTADLPVRRRRAPDRPPAGRAPRAALRGARPRDGRSEVAEPRLDAGHATRRRRRSAAGSTCGIATASPVPAEFIAGARSTTRAGSPGPTDRSATCASSDRLERELRPSPRSAIRFLVENSPDVVFSTDVEGRFTFLSDAIERMTGWHPDELIGEHFSKIVESEELQAAGSPLGGAGRGPGPWSRSGHAGLKGPDGAPRPGRGQRDRDRRRRRRVRRDPGVDPRRQRARPARGRAAPPGRRAGRRRGARPPGPRAARLGHAGAVLDDASSRDRWRCCSTAIRTPPASSWPSSASSSARPSPRCARSSSSCAPATSSRTGWCARSRPTLRRSRAGSGCRSSSRARSPDRLPLAVEEVLYRIAQEALHNVVKHAAARQVRVDVVASTGGRPAAGRGRRQGLRPDDASPTAISVWPGCAPGPSRIGARFTLHERARQGDHDRGDHRPRCARGAARGRAGRRRAGARRAIRRRRRSATDDVAAGRRSAERSPAKDAVTSTDAAARWRHVPTPARSDGPLRVRRRRCR